VATAAGVTFVHRTGAQGGWHYVETMGSGCALFDYDGDGDLDLYLVNGANLPGQPAEGTNALYRNEGKGEIYFTDVTRQAGVPGRGYGMGCAVGDYDNDGRPDLYVTGYPENVLYRNNGDGAFADVTQRAGVAAGGWCSGATFFDFDRDGYLDLFVVGYLDYDLRREPPCERVGIRTYCDPAFFNGARSRLYRNNRDGTFTEVSLAAGIVDSTGKGMSAVSTDFDGDGDADLYVANDTTPNFLYRNDQKGLTAEDAKSAEQSSRRGGERGSGRKGEETFPPLSHSPILPFEGGERAFVEVGLEMGAAYSGEGKAQAGMGVDAGDFDNDGDEDLIVANFSYETNALYRNDGGTFVDATETAGLSGPSFLPLGFGVNFLDSDNDGDLDLFVANGQIFPNVAAFSAAESYAQRAHLFRNEGGVFREVGAEAGIDAPGVGRGSAVGDIDRDGDLDIVVINSGGRPRVWRNDSVSQNHWLVVKLVGGVKTVLSPELRVLSQKTKNEKPKEHSALSTQHSALSNRDGIGARVFVTAGGRTQVREARSQSSYLSVSDVRLHFGLGAADRVDRVEVRWPGGGAQRLSDIRIDQVVIIEEER